MNKKVLTLCASALLVGGLIGTANAAKLTDVVDNGKYYQLKMSKKSDGTSWAATPTTWAAQYLSIDADGPSFLTTPDAKEGFWTIVDVQKPGESLPTQTTGKIQLVNASTGKPLSITFGTAPNTKVIDEFYTEDGPTGDVLGLVFYEGGVRYQLGGVSTTGTTQDNLTYGQYSSPSGIYFAGLEAEEIPEVALKAKQMNSQLSGGFELSFTSNGKEYKNLTQAEAFAGKLTAVGVNVTDPDDANEVANSTDTEYYFRTSDGRYVILDDEYLGTNTATLDGTKSAFYRGYNFTTISEHAFAQLTKKEKKNAAFTVFRTYDFNDTDSLIVAVPGANTIGELPNKGLNQTLPDGSDNPEKGLRLFISTVTVSGVQSDVLTTIDYTKANDMLAAVKDNNYNNAQMGALAPYIAFGSTNIVNWKAFAGKVWNITDEEGNVLSPKADGDIDWSDPDYTQLFAPAEEVDKTNPEGQWLLDDAENCFVNRESGELAFKSNKGWTIRNLGNDKYALYNSKFATKAEYTIYITEAKNAELGWTENGYVKFDMDEELNNGKYMSFETALGTAYIGKDADDNVILTTNPDEAIEFRVKQLTHDFRDHDGVIAPDTLQHYTSFLNKDAKGKTFVDVDTLQFFHYALYENFSEKYLMYNPKTKKFQLSDESWTSNAHENFDQEGATVAFVVKTREDGSYIWVRDYAIDYDECKDDATHDHEIQLNWNKEDATFDNIFEVNFGSNALTVWDEDGDEISRKAESNGQAHKLYAGTQKGGFLTDMADIYNYNDNDRITIEATNKVEYRRFDTLDTIKVSLEAKTNFFLYEHNENGTNFLSMEHVADADMKAAIFVDTAYVRNETYRPQYLLAVGANHVDEIWDNHGSKDPVHLLHADTTYGRFLVNMVDSAKAWKGSVKTNPYIHEELNGNYYYRLAFIDGYHTGDALYLNTENAKTKINLGNNNEKVCTFSFRYVDEDREGVKIETTYDGKTRGWLKYQNNVPVVTNDYEDAHVFLIDNTTTEAPTANEAINAEGAISVTAIDGAVVIKGAEGKNVVIATILGKVVANETVNSDNETIAVPAGIAVVSVDGESFKVVVK